MYILFTRNNSIVSRMIQAVTRENVSHCAIEHGGFVYHSNFLGVHIETTHHFYTNNEVMYSVETDRSVDALRDAVSEHEGKMYDFGGILYIALRYWLPFLPKANLWQSTGMLMCTEWVEEVLGNGIPDAELTPYKLYLLLSSPSQ